MPTLDETDLAQLARLAEQTFDPLARRLERLIAATEAAREEIGRLAAAVDAVGARLDALGRKDPDPTRPERGTRHGSSRARRR